MRLILNHKEPDDFVISTGETHSIRDFLDVAFKHIGVEDWHGYIGTDERFMRPAEVDVLRGDSTKAYEKLGWKPKTSFEELVSKMIDNDIKLIGSK